MIRTGPGAEIALVAGLLAVAAISLLGQPAEPPRFAVATIKRNPSREPLSMAVALGVGYRPGGRLVATNAPVRMLIWRSYAVQPFQVVGGPQWIDTDGYDIEAKPESPVDQARMWLMLQTLLADRFHLAMHRDTRELPVYDLKAVKDPSHLPKPERECSETLGPPPGRGEPRPKPPCGPGTVSAGTGAAAVGISVTMPDLAKYLSTLLGREVIDKTGYTDRFALHVEFALDDVLAGLPSPKPIDSSAPAADSKPSLFTALQQQLGVKLESSKGPVDVLVIDRVERPTEN